MSFSGAPDPSAVDLNVTEIAAILRQVQSGQFTELQQQTFAHGGTSSSQHGLRTEADRGLSLVQNTQANYGTSSQIPLRRPGRAPAQEKSGDNDAGAFSRSALQKQIFAARMMGAPAVGLSGKPGGGAQGSGHASGSLMPNIKPNLAAASRHHHHGHL